MAPLRLRVLSDEQLQAIHAATMQILETTGVSVETPEVVDLLKQHGADVQGDRVRLPARLVTEALASAPRTVQLYDRTGQPAIELGAGKSYFGAWLDNQFLYDGPNQLRTVLHEDIANAVKVIDQLDQLAWICWAGWVSDVPFELRNKAIFRTAMSLSTKPIVTTALDVADLEAQLEMAAIAVGGYEQLRARPFLANASEPVSPLLLSSEGLAKMQICARRGVPFVYYSMTEAGSSAPCTPVGPLLIGNVEILAGLVVHQLTAPGAPFIYGNMPGMMDMKTLVVSYGAPELFLGLAGLSDLGHFYGLPVYGTAGSSDSMDIDAQLGAENALSLFLALLTTADLVHDVACFGGGMVGGVEANVFANEVLGMIRKITQGIEVNAETLALDAIAEVGPRGEFISHETTFANYRNLWYPDLFTREPAQTWLRKSERPTLATRLGHRVTELVDKYEGRPLAPDVVAELDESQRRWTAAALPA